MGGEENGGRRRRAGKRAGRGREGGRGDGGEVWVILEGGNVGVVGCDEEGRPRKWEGGKGEGEGQGGEVVLIGGRGEGKGKEEGEGGGGGLCRCGDGMVISWGEEGGEGGLGVWDKEKKTIIGQEVFFLLLNFKISYFFNYLSLPPFLFLFSSSFFSLSPPFSFFLNLEITLYYFSLCIHFSGGDSFD